MHLDNESLVKNSYDLIKTLQIERNKKGDRITYSIKSRGKLRNLSAPFMELGNTDDALNRFREYTHKSLEHGSAKTTFEKLLERMYHEPEKDADDATPQGVITKIDSTSRRVSPEVRASMIRYILGYTNWGAESICAIFSAYPKDDNVVRIRLTSMINAEFAVIWEKTGLSDEMYTQKLVEELLTMKQKADGAANKEKNHV